MTTAATQILVDSPLIATPPERPEASRALTIAATFTADPVTAAIETCARRLAPLLDVRLAPYGQVFQQLLDPRSEILTNRSGAGVLLVRLEDFIPADGSEQLAKRTELPGDISRFTLPNGVEIAHANAYETQYLYHEIFEDRVYLRHGISIQDGDCVVDIGANIGMFSLFARGAARNVKVFSCEPSPRLGPILRANADLAGNICTFECGVSDADGAAEFTFYPKSSVFSGFHADAGVDSGALRAIIENQLTTSGSGGAGDREALAAELVAGRLEAEKCECRLRSLSSIIDQESIERIDLLKIDAERSEWAVLQGIRAEHWGRISQIAIEVHGPESLDQATGLLREKGFEVFADVERLLENSGLFTVYAVRADRRPLAPAHQNMARAAARLGDLVNEFVSTLRVGADRAQTPLIVAICAPSARAQGDAVLGPKLSEYERFIVEQAREIPGVHVISSSDLMAQYPVSCMHDEYALELAHIPYTPAYFAALGAGIARRFCALSQSPVKALAVDADGTLWSGVCGESGPLGVVIDDARREFHDFLTAQVRAGVMLFVCSKNHLDDVRDVFRRNPGMKLREEDVAGWYVNWDAKADNLRAIARELNIGLDAVLLLDDNPLECAEVRSHAPGAMAIQTPADSRELAHFARHLWILDRPGTTKEDLQRNRFHAANNERRKLQHDSLNYASFLGALELRCDIAGATAGDWERIAQLSHRTNQFNLNKCPYTAKELASLAAQPRSGCLSVRAADRFGDYGLVGAVRYELSCDLLRAPLFFLSCRALGRGVEYRMLARLGEIAREAACSYVELPFVPSPRNEPILRFLRSLDCRREGTIFTIATEAACRAVALEVAEALPENEPAGAPAPAPAAADAEAVEWIARNLSTVEGIVSAMSRHRPVASSSAGPGVLDPLRTQLHGIWADLLRTGSFGIHDDFIALGGNSLLLVQSASCVRRMFGCPLSIDEAFQLRTVEALACWLEERDLTSGFEPPVMEHSLNSIDRLPGDPTPLSPAQQSFLFLQEISPDSWAYNVVFGAHSAQSLDAGALKRSFERLIARHPSLHSVYQTRAGQSLAIPSPDVPVDFEEVSAESLDAAALEMAVRAECRRPFDLRRGPVLRLRLYQSQPALLLLVVHHIGVDLWSVEIMVRDLIKFYLDELANPAAANSVAAPEFHYGDFVAWQRQMLGGPEGEPWWDYWRRELSGDLPTLKLRLVRRRLGAPRPAGCFYRFNIDGAMTAALRAFASQESATLFQVLLAGYGALLFRHTGQPDILIGSPFAGRNAEQFDEVVGNFVNLLPLRLPLAGRPSFRRLLQSVRRAVLGAMENQHFPFSQMVRRLRARSEPGRMPLVQTSFALHEPRFVPGIAAFFLQGNHEGGIRFQDLELTPAGLTQQEGQFDIALEMVAQGNGLSGAFKYDSDLLDEATARQFAFHYTSLLRRAIAGADGPIDSLPLDAEPEASDRGPK